ncbi:helix-turn-helix domain-containing protein [Mycobacterium tuberculosis]|uniref:helix-turn-helix domain-containing protein n=1 Tax=Mycobacterium tuberculosis TaxID=1773 RepID=UPI0012A844BB|nr:helix-turn-helix domain-containing protein [Mycobacterium tuberculosis]QGK80297.1 helix-turn-helix domain-containing protein [Mycobacterium tuberculosis]
MTMARNWRDIRADAVAQGRVDLQRAAVAREEMRDAVLAHRLAEIRKALGHARQADVAALMGVSQARVSKLESGDLSHTELGTLQAYVAALGGHLRIVVNRPGMSGDSSSWKGWGHVRWFIEEVPAGAA